MAPGNAQILFNLGYANHAVGRYAEAVDCYRRCTTLEPGRVETWVNLAAAARAGGDLTTAVSAQQALLQRRPDDAAAHGDMGTLLAEAGRAEDAVASYRRALLLDATRSDTRMNLANVLLGLGRVAEAEACYREALANDPGALWARRALVTMLDQQNRVDEAEAVLAETPGGVSDPGDWLTLGNLQLRQGRVADAESSYGNVLTHMPSHAATLSNLGLVRVLRGDRDGAETLFRQALAADDQFTEPWRHLAALKRFDDCEDPEIHAMRERQRDRRLSANAVMHLDFALGKAFDDCGRYDDAFEHFRRANAECRRQRPFDTVALGDHAARIRTVFDGCSEPVLKGDDSMLPVYIVGMPRTGTTLLEQMLSAHPAFHGAGELLLVNRLIAELESASSGVSTPYPECVRELTGETVSALAIDYLAALRETAPGDGVTRVSDKMPYNFFHLGLVRMLFPRARIIHCRRDPADTCLSAWFNYFPRGLDYTYAFEDLAAVYAIYRDMMDHWRDHPRVDFLTIDYEALTADPRTVLEATLDHLGLAWDERVLSFHEHAREVRTLSAWQVRQPLHGGSRRRWRRYVSHIGPLLEALAPWMETA